MGRSASRRPHTDWGGKVGVSINEQVVRQSGADDRQGRAQSDGAGRGTMGVERDGGAEAKHKPRSRAGGRQGANGAQVRGTRRWGAAMGRYKQVGRSRVQ